MANHAVNIPDLGQEKPVDIIELSVKLGDRITKDQVLLVMESDKATLELNAPFSGTIKTIYLKKGDKVSTGAQAFELEDETITAPNTQPNTQPKTLTATPEATRTQEPTTIPKPTAAPEPTTSTKASTTPSPLAAPPPLKEAGSSEVLAYAGPAVRKLAHELGVDLNKVIGSGPKTRILKEDVHLHVKQKLDNLPPKREEQENSVFILPDIDFSKWGDIEKQPLTPIQKISGERLTRNWQMIPHVTQFDSADITNLEAFRKSESEALKTQNIKLTFLSFLVKAVSFVLQKYPKFNASLSKDQSELIIKKYIHVGIAVDTPNGLVVPVIKDSNKKSVIEIAEELQRLSEKARNKKLTPNEMQGGTFTVSSLGGIGGSAFTPIINWPEVAILGVSRAELKPVFATPDQWEARLILPLSLSYDHRVIDGAEAARFTAALTHVLGDMRRCLF